MKIITQLVILLAFTASSIAEITHENQFSLKDVKVWHTLDNGYDGDYVALEGDHTSASSVHIRAYTEAETLYLWLTIISQDDLAALPTIKTFPKYERTRTNGTFKVHEKVEYIRFVDFKGTQGVVLDNKFYKLTKG